MQNTKFVDLTQTTIFHIWDLFQSIFLTIIQPQITQEPLKHSKEWITPFSWDFKVIQREWEEGKRITQFFSYWFTQSHSYI